MRRRITFKQFRSFVLLGAGAAGIIAFWFIVQHAAFVGDVFVMTMAGIGTVLYVIYAVAQASNSLEKEAWIHGLERWVDDAQRALAGYAIVFASWFLITPVVGLALLLAWRLSGPNKQGGWSLGPH